MRIKSPVFVGRRAELERLINRLAEAQEGRPSVIVLGGEAGIGKSRLVAEFSVLAEREGARVLSGAAADYGEGGLPFGPIMEALRPIDSDPTGLGGRGAVGATGGTDLERASVPELRISLSQQRVFDRLVGLLDASAAEVPTVLLLEDLHWADASTREFISFLARNLGSMRLLVVGTYRSDDVRRDHPLRRYLNELDRSGRIERISLARFSREELGQQLSAIAGQPVGPELVDRLFDRSQGNAFLSEELFAAQLQGTALPPDLKELLLARLEGLPAETRRLLAAAAVAGRADEEFLAAVTDQSAEEVVEGIRRAIDHFVLEPAAQPAFLGYAFRHALLREAIYDDLLSAERLRLHRRVAEVMAASLPTGAGGNDARLLAQLAHHWQRAQRPEEAFVASWRAGEAAERSMAYPEAARQFERVAELWAQVDRPSARLAEQLAQSGQDAPADMAYVLQRAAEAAATAGELKRSAGQLQKAAELVDAAREPDRAILIQLNLANDLNDIGDAPGSDLAITRAHSLLGSTTTPAIRAEVFLSNAGLRGITGRAQQALEHSLEALAAAEEANDPRLIAESHVTIGGSLAFMGRLDEGLEHYTTARTVALQAGLEGLAAAADKWRGVILDAAARFADAIETLEGSQVIGRRLGLSRLVRHTDAVIAQSLHRSGRWQDAVQSVERSLISPTAEWGRVVAAYLYAGLGRFDDTASQLELAWPSVRVSESSASYGPYFAALAEMRGWQGDAAGAISAAQEGLRLVAPMEDLRWIGDLSMLGARAAAELRDAGVRQAEQLASGARDAMERHLSSGTIFAAEIEAAVATVEAEVGRARAESDPARWAMAAGAWRNLEEPYPAAYAYHRQAEAAYLRRDRADAAVLLNRAHELATGLGAAPLLTEIEAFGRRARLDLKLRETERAAGRQSARDYGLTAREREVLAMLAAGQTDQQIAEALFISPKTASVHVSNIKGKLGVQRRIEAAAVGLQLAGVEAENRV